MADFGAAPSKTESKKAVLDDVEGPAVLTASSSASAEERRQIFDPSEETPSDGNKVIADALQSISPENPENILDRMCPMCGWDHSVKNVVQPTDQDKTDFVIAAVSSMRFKKVYPCFGGRIKITMRSRTYAETEAVMEHVERWRKKEGIEAANAIIIKTYVYQALFSLELIEFEGKEAQKFPELNTAMPETNEEQSDVEKAEARFKAELSEILYQSVQNASRHFDQLVSFLTLRAHDPNFWDGIATSA